MNVRFMHVGIRRALLFTGASMLLALTGCATHQPPALPADQLASISTDRNSHRLRFMAEDGVNLTAIGSLNSFAGRDDLRLQPGKRTVQVDYTEAVGTGPAKGGVLLVFETHGGKRYVVRERTEGSRLVAWLTTDNSDKVPLLNPS